MSIKIIDNELLCKTNKFFTPDKFNHVLKDLVSTKYVLYMHLNIL